MKRKKHTAAGAEDAAKKLKAQNESAVLILSDSDDETPKDNAASKKGMLGKAFDFVQSAGAFALAVAGGDSNNASSTSSSSSSAPSSQDSAAATSNAIANAAAMTKEQKMAIVQAMPWFSKIDTSGMKPQYTRRMMGELARLFVDTEHKDFVEFFPPMANDLSKFHFLFKTSAAEEGSQLRKSLEKHGCSGIKCEMNIPPDFPVKGPVFIRILHPKLSGGYVFSHGAICFEPLTPKGHSAAMSLPSLCIALQAFFNTSGGGGALKVERSSPDGTIREYNLADAQKEIKYIINAHSGGSAWSQQMKDMKS